MSKREKLIARMRATPGSIRFSEMESLLQYEGFVLEGSRGAHRRFRHPDGRSVSIVDPHGGRKTCDPKDVKKLLGALRL